MPSPCAQRCVVQHIIHPMHRGVFCNLLHTCIHTVHPPLLLSQLEREFEELDVDHDGYITAEDLVAASRSTPANITKSANAAGEGAGPATQRGEQRQGRHGGQEWLVHTPQSRMTQQCNVCRQGDASVVCSGSLLTRHANMYTLQQAQLHPAASAICIPRCVEHQHQANHPPFASAAAPAAAILPPPKKQLLLAVALVRTACQQRCTRWCMRCWVMS
jgi:hypothetical protein